MIWRILTIIWLCVIFGLSCIPGKISSELSRCAIAKTSKTFFGITNSKWLHYYIRRSCHSMEFFVVEILLTFSFDSRLESQMYAINIAVVVAVIDEVIKLFIKGRHFSLEDIFLDLIGIFLAVGLLQSI